MEIRRPMAASSRGGAAGWACWLLTVACWAGCSESSQPDPMISSETHFLDGCEDGCGELSCLEGVCTLPCQNDDPCTELLAEATCSGAGVCDVSCAASSECGVLEDAHTCQAGQCRLPPTEPLSCGDRRTAAGQLITTAVDAQPDCTSVDDCVWVGTDTMCGGACGVVVHSEAAQAVADAVMAADTGVCVNYAEDGCPFATPGCLEPQPACNLGRCEWEP